MQIKWLWSVWNTRLSWNMIKTLENQTAVINFISFQFLDHNANTNFIHANVLMRLLAKNDLDIKVHVMQARFAETFLINFWSILTIKITKYFDLKITNQDPKINSSTRSSNRPLAFCHKAPEMKHSLLMLALFNKNINAQICSKIRGI